jgi:hypothetical protein
MQRIAQHVYEAYLIGQTAKKNMAMVVGWYAANVNSLRPSSQLIH